MRVAVIGAGVAGLAAALEVSRLRPDAEVVVYEQSPVVGGKLRTGLLAGHPVDVGAEAMLARRPEGLELLAAAGLADERIDPLTTSASVWTPTGLRPIPGGTVMGVPGDVDAARRSGLFSAAAVARIAHEAQAEHKPVTEDVAVGRLVADRLGPEVVDRLVDPLLGGVYAGRAGRLSLRATVPTLAAALADGGSLVAAAARAAAGSARTAPGSAAPGSAAPGSAAPGSAAPGSAASGSGQVEAAASGSGPAASGPTVAAPVFASVRGGLGRLPDALVDRAPFTVRTSTAVRAIRRTATGFALAIGARPDGVEVRADAVIVATPPVKAAVLLRDLAPTAAHELSSVDTASVAIVSIAVETSAATSLPPGSGLLVPAGAPSLVKGVTISSQKWPGAPIGLALIRASIGRFGDEAVLQRDDAELAARAVADLGVLLGTELVPVDTLVTRWGGALPQYDVGHVDRVARIRSAVATVPGLAVAGATFDGVGIPACVASGRTAAVSALASAPPVTPTTVASTTGTPTTATPTLVTPTHPPPPVGGGGQ